ncbi:hypothetical protein GGR42_000439 [Saonia flava]|uniref:Uncharacterized protein n=1 Tax=Saonia flava TaxID=523696 RepID=A0A846QS05_9FLAO|nr:hypothetical protein [Saonia flava]NJB69977.1 hypothetical protein [Saonia flava]
MKKIFLGIIICAVAGLTIAAKDSKKNSFTENFIIGTPEIKSVNALSFGPEGILFIGDSKNATIYALDTKDVENSEKTEKIDIGSFDKKIASSLGTTADNIKITDMAVNPISKIAYFSVSIMDGTSILLKLNGDILEHVSLDNVSYSKIALKDAIEADAKDRRGRSQRVWAISDMQYHNGKIMVSGLSNKEFSSTFRSIPFPFKGSQDYASLEVYHAAHGRYETYAPIKTFGVVAKDGKDYLMASYTCTPLVLFPMDELKDGKHIKGRTVAEFGWGNSPLDIVSYQKEGKTYFLMSNSNRPVMRINYDDIVSSKDDITEKVETTEGVEYFSLPMVNVLQMDILNGNTILYMQRTSNGELVLRTRGV